MYITCWKSQLAILTTQDVIDSPNRTVIIIGNQPSKQSLPPQIEITIHGSLTNLAMSGRQSAPTRHTSCARSTVNDWQRLWRHHQQWWRNQSFNTHKRTIMEREHLVQDWTRPDCEQTWWQIWQRIWKTLDQEMPCEHTRWQEEQRGAPRQKMVIEPGNRRPPMIRHLV